MVRQIVLALRRKVWDGLLDLEIIQTKDKMMEHK
jgi:hypothetical protein